MEDGGRSLHLAQGLRRSRGEVSLEQKCGRGDGVSHARIQRDILAAVAERRGRSRAERRPHAGAAWGRGDSLEPRPRLSFLFRAQSGVSQSSEQRSKISQTGGLRAEVTEVVQVSWSMLPWPPPLLDLPDGASNVFHLKKEQRCHPLATRVVKTTLSKMVHCRLQSMYKKNVPAPWGKDRSFGEV